MTKDDLLVFVRWLNDKGITLVYSYGDEEGNEYAADRHPVNLDYILEQFLGTQGEPGD